jgi:hypothetical protein
VKSLNGQPILQFPTGYNGLLIEDAATFKSTPNEMNSLDASAPEEQVNNVDSPSPLHPLPER